MTMTPNSASAPFCSPASFATVYDWRTFGQLISDSDAPNTYAAFVASPTTLAKLQIAAGQIEMAASIGGRYDPILDLVQLVTPVAGVICNGGWALIQMNADLAAFEFYGRRYEGMPDWIQKAVDQAIAKLAALEEGTAIFPFLQTQQAGLISDYEESATDVEKRNLPSFVAHRCFGRRDNRLPYGG